MHLDDTQEYTQMTRPDHRSNIAGCLAVRVIRQEEGGLLTQTVHNGEVPNEMVSSERLFVAWCVLL